MITQPTHGNGAIESPTIEMSQEGLRSILSQIEAELLDSEVYCRTIAGLETMLGESSSTAQILVKAVGREAVRLTFQQFAKHYKVVPVTSNSTNQVIKEELDSPQMVQDNPVKIESQASATSVEEVTISDVTNSVETTKPPSLIKRLISNSKPNQKVANQKVTKAERTAQTVVLEREEILRQVGQELRQAREARSLSVQQLHNQTLVPLHHIEALEAGRLDQLPEDVYIRGFIRRLAHILGSNGDAMAASLPAPDPVKSVVPSWHNSLAVPGGGGGFQLSSVHLYLGYTALIAGAVGGLSWMSQQSTPGVSVQLEPTGSSQATVAPNAERAELSSKPGLKSSKTGVKAGADIAPPEAMPF